MKRIKRLAKEGLWVFAGQISTVIGALVLVRVLTEHLDPSQYGQLALGMTIAALVSQVGMGGVINAIGRFYSISIEKNDLIGYIKACNRLMSYALIGTILIAMIIMGGLLLAGQVQWIGLATAILIFSILTGYNSAIGGIQNAARKRDIVAMHSGMEAWLKIGLTLGVIFWIGSSITAVVLGYALSALFVTVSQLFFLQNLLRKQSSNSLSSSSEDWCRKMLLFAWPMMAGGLFNWGYYASQRWALELFVSSDDVGKFYALTQVAYSPISIAGGLFMSMMVPILYSRAADPDNQQIITNVKLIVFKLAKFGLIATFALAIISYFLHEEIFKIFVGEKYIGVSPYMPIVVISAGVLQSSIAMGSILATENKTNKILPLAIYGQSFIILFNMIFTYLYGMQGLIFSMLFGATIHLTWMYIIINKKNYENHGKI